MVFVVVVVVLVEVVVVVVVVVVQLRISLNSLLVLVTTEGIFENTTNSGNNDRSRNTKTDIVGNCCMP